MCVRRTCWNPSQKQITVSPDAHQTAWRAVKERSLRPQSKTGLSRSGTSFHFVPLYESGTALSMTLVFVLAGKKQQHTSVRVLEMTTPRSILNYFNLFLGHPVAFVVVEIAFPESYGMRCHFHVFVIADPFDRLFERHDVRSFQADRLV